MATGHGEATKLSTTQAQEIRKLSKELEQVLGKIATIVFSNIGVKKPPYNVATVILKSTSHPLQIGFGNKKISVVQPGHPVKESDLDIGYYEDPPGICTDIPACFS
jgi:hypothetical protein